MLKRKFPQRKMPRGFFSHRHRWDRSDSSDIELMLVVVVAVAVGFIMICMKYPGFVWTAIGLSALYAIWGEVQKIMQPGATPKVNLLNNRSAFTLAFQLAGYITEKSSSNKQLRDLYLDRTCTTMDLSSLHWNNARAAFEQGRLISDEFIMTTINSSLQAGMPSKMIDAVFFVAMGPIFFDKVLTAEELRAYQDLSTWLGISQKKSKKFFDALCEKYGFRKMGDGTYFSEGNSFEGFFDKSESESGAGGESSYDESDSPSNGIIDERAARTLLGVSSSASQKEVRRAYKKLMMANHPDRAASQGWDDAEIAKRTAISQKIQAAWETVCKAQGW